MPPEQDWISAFYNCSVERAWNKVFVKVQRDIETWKTFNQDEVDNVSLKREEDSKSFRVSRILPYKLHWASLTIRDQQLDLQRGVEDTSSGLQTPKTSHLFPTVNIEGVCLIYTGNMQLEFSQVSQLMLAPLLFPEVKTDLKQVKVTLL